MPGTLDVSGVDVLDIRAHEVAELDQGHWPCPGCGERRNVVQSLDVRIRNRAGDPMERWVRLCRPCATPLPFAGATDAQADQATTAGEPWLEGLEDVATVMDALSVIEAGRR